MTNQKIKAHQGSNNDILKKQAKLAAKTSGGKEVLTLDILDTGLWEPYGLDIWYGLVLVFLVPAFSPSHWGIAKRVGCF